MEDIFIELSSDIDGELSRFIMGEESLTVNATLFSTVGDISKGRSPTTSSEIEFQLNEWFCFSLQASRPPIEKQIAELDILPDMSKENMPILEEQVTSIMCDLYPATFCSCFDREKAVQLHVRESLLQRFH
jgi:hypothetical protein